MTIIKGTPECNLVRCDHQSSNKRGFVWIYYKTSPHLRVSEICLLQESAIKKHYHSLNIPINYEQITI